MNKKRKKLLIFSIAIISVVLSVMVYFKLTNKNKIASNDTNVAIKTKDSRKGTDDVAKIDDNLLNYKKLVVLLEKPSEHETDDISNEIKGFIEDNITKIKELDNDKMTDYVGNLDNHLGMTDKNMIYTLSIAVRYNDYSFDKESTEVYKSKNEDVDQFILVFKADNKPNLYFFGNYNTLIKSIQLSRYLGGDLSKTFG